MGLLFMVSHQCSLCKMERKIFIWHTNKKWSFCAECPCPFSVSMSFLPPSKHVRCSGQTLHCRVLQIMSHISLWNEHKAFIVCGALCEVYILGSFSGHSHFMLFSQHVCFTGSGSLFPLKPNQAALRNRDDPRLQEEIILIFMIFVV